MNLRLYSNIYNIARNRGVTIKEMEMNLGFSNGSIGRWNVSDPGISKVIAVANYLDVSLETLVYNDQRLIWSDFEYYVFSNGVLKNNTHSVNYDKNVDLLNGVKEFDRIRFENDFISCFNEFISNKKVFLFTKFNKYTSFDPLNIANFTKVLLYSSDINSYRIGYIEFYDRSTIFRPIDTINYSINRPIIQNSNAWILNSNFDVIKAICHGEFILY